MAVLLLATACSVGGSDLGVGGSANRVIEPIWPIANCADIDAPVSTVEPSPNPSDATSRVVRGIITTHTDAHPDTFAGSWTDQEAGGVIVFAFTDDPGPHRDAILARAPTLGDADPPLTLAERDDVAIDVVQVRYSRADLDRFQDSLRQVEWGKGLGSAPDLPRNRLQILLFDPTDEDFANLLDRIPADAMCVEVTITPPRPAEPIEIIPTAQSDPLVSCGRDDVEIRYSRWLDESDDQGCNPRVVYPEGMAPMHAVLDPAFPPPNADTTTIHLIVHEQACASGQLPGDRLLEPQVIETDTEVLLGFGAVRVVGGAGCAGNLGGTPLTIELASPLGERTIADGTYLPPRPITNVDTSVSGAIGG